jgi:2-polyprenyl-3-methyl-5-hydroxy-6-metoxy-1,4-benzoquinol methylase
MSNEISLRDFQSYYPYAPTALAIKECVRLSSMRGLKCEGPILDVGCGDGLFARLAFQDAEVWGIDIDGNEGRRAQASRAYSQVMLADITRARLPESFFGSCIANCSLEHIPDLGAALRTIYKSLKPGGVVYAFLPNRDWASYMATPRALEKLGLGSLSSTVCEAINQQFRHQHLEDAEGWARWFREAGFEVPRVEPIGSTASTVTFEMFLLPSLLGLVSKKLTGRWTLFPSLRHLEAVPVYALVRGLLSLQGESVPTAEFLVEGRKPL